MVSPGIAAVLGVTVVAFASNWAWEITQCRPFFVHPVPCRGPLAMARSAIADVGLTWIAYAAVALLSQRWGWLLHPWGRRQWAGIFRAAVLLSIGVEQVALATGRWAYTAANPLLPGTGVSVIPVLQLLLLIPASFAVGAALGSRRSRTPPADQAPDDRPPVCLDAVTRQGPPVTRR